MAGHNARDGLTSHGFMGFGNDATDNDDASSLRTNAAATAAGRKWGNIIQVRYVSSRGALSKRECALSRQVENRSVLRKPLRTKEKERDPT